MSSSGPRTTRVQEFKWRLEPRWEERRRTRRRWRRTRRTRRWWRRRRRRAEKWSEHRSEFDPLARRAADWHKPSDRYQCDPTDAQHIANSQPAQLLCRGAGGDRLQQHLCRQIPNKKDKWQIKIWKERRSKTDSLRNSIPDSAAKPGESAESLLQRPFSVEHRKPQRDHSSKVGRVVILVVEDQPFNLFNSPQQSRY